MEKDVALTSKILLPICRGNLRLRLRFPAGVPLRGVEDEGGEEAASAGGAPVANERRVWVMFPSSCNSVEDARAFVASRFLAGSWLARPIHFFLQGYVVPGCEMVILKLCIIYFIDLHNGIFIYYIDSRVFYAARYRGGALRRAAASCVASSDPRPRPRQRPHPLWAPDRDRDRDRTSSSCKF